MGFSDIGKEQQFYINCRNSAVEKALIDAERCYEEDCLEKRQFFERKADEYYKAMAYPDPSYQFYRR
jgi:hypothetical protein